MEKRTPYRNWQKGLGSFLSGLTGSARTQLQSLREKKEADDAAAAQAAQKMRELYAEFAKSVASFAPGAAQELGAKAGMEIPEFAPKPGPQGDTSMEEFSRWRRAVDPSGLSIEPEYAWDIYDTERIVRTAQKPEDRVAARAKLTQLRSQNQRAVSETVRRMEDVVRKTNPGWTPDQIRNYVIEARKQGYSIK